MLPLAPDMASLSVGSNNFPTRVYENPPDLVNWLASEMKRYRVTPEVEAFDLSHLLTAIRMHGQNELYGKLYVQFVMGVKNAMPADKEVFDLYVKIMNERAPKAEWCAAGIGANQIIVNEWAIAAGGHTRSGLEDNVRLDKNTLAPSNAALIQRAVEICEKYERPVATWRQTREILNLKIEA
tara:strand:- start:100 stop:645 length:546 start_codon:yes stop_codon:yes gene_type:complete